MLDGKNALKLSGDHIDFNLNLKIIVLLLFDAQKKYFYKKKNVTETFDFLVSFIPPNISVGHEIQEDKRT